MNRKNKTLPLIVLMTLIYTDLNGGTGAEITHDSRHRA